MRMAGCPIFTLIPVEGSLERFIYDLFISERLEGFSVKCLSQQLGTDADSVLHALNNLRHGMFRAENDFELTFDA
jgi:hypothetical protein